MPSPRIARKVPTSLLRLAHTSRQGKVYLSSPRTKAERLRAALGIGKTVADPAPSWAEALGDDNLVLSDRISLRLSAGPGSPSPRGWSVLALDGRARAASRSLVVANLLQLSSSYVVHDPDGSLLASCGGLMRAHGYDVVSLDASEPSGRRGALYDPVRNVSAPYGIRDFANLALTAQGPFLDDADEDVDPDFLEAAHALVCAAVAYLCTFYADQPDERTLDNVVRLLGLAEREEAGQKASALDVLMLGSLSEHGFKGFEERVVSEYGGDALAAAASGDMAAADLYRRFKALAGSPSGEAAVADYARIRLAPLRDREAEGGPSIDLGQIGASKRAVFVRSCPFAPRASDVLAAMIFSQAVDACLAERARWTVPVQIVLAGLPDIAPIPRLFERMARATARGTSVIATAPSPEAVERAYPSADRFDAVVRFDDADVVSVRVSGCPDVGDRPFDATGHPRFEEAGRDER